MLTCRTRGIFNFFDDNVTLFESIAAQGEAAVLEALSADRYPDGGEVSPDGLFVDAVRDSNGILQSARMVIWVSPPRCMHWKQVHTSAPGPGFVLTCSISTLIQFQTVATYNGTGVSQTPPVGLEHASNIHFFSGLLVSFGGRYETKNLHRP